MVRVQSPLCNSPETPTEETNHAATVDIQTIATCLVEVLSPNAPFVSPALRLNAKLELNTS